MQTEELLAEQESNLPEPITRSEVLDKTIPWANFVKVGLLNDSELQTILSFDKKSIDDKLDLLDEESFGPSCLGLLFRLLGSLHSLDSVQYIAALLNDVISAEPDRVLRTVVALSATADIVTPLFTALERPEHDWFLCRESALLLASVFCAHNSTLATEKALERMFSFLKAELCFEDILHVRIAVNTLQRLLQRPELRKPIGSQSLPLLTNVVSANTQPLKFQLLYETIFCVWLTLFDPELAETPYPELVEALSAVLRLIPKEKCRRVSVASLRRLALSRENRQSMLACRVLKAIAPLMGVKSDDPEFADDLRNLSSALTREEAEMSSWDVFRAELYSGHLSWSPVHRSDKFWRENVAKLAEENAEPLRRLVAIANGSDPLAIAVACSDLGEFSRFHPRGRTLIAEVNAKEALLGLLTHTDPDVRRNALFALQKIMSAKSEYVGV